MKFLELVQKYKEELAETLTRESGKILRKQEMKSIIYSPPGQHSVKKQNTCTEP